MPVTCYGIPKYTSLCSRLYHLNLKQLIDFWWLFQISQIKVKELQKAILKIVRPSQFSKSIVFYFAGLCIRFMKLYVRELNILNDKYPYCQGYWLLPKFVIAQILGQFIMITLNNMDVYLMVIKLENFLQKIGHVGKHVLNNLLLQCKSFVQQGWGWRTNSF